MPEANFVKIGKLARHGALPRRQRGVVLLITLIVLVAMMLAGIGMMRSIDTTTMIAGNVAFRESTLHAGDIGINTPFAKMLQIAAVPGDKIALYYNDKFLAQIATNPLAPGVLTNVCPGMLSPSLCRPDNTINFDGYMATPFNGCEIFPPGSAQACPDPKMYQWWKDPINWVAAPSIPVNDASGGQVARVYYWIHRMCLSANQPPSGAATPGMTQQCQTIQENVDVTGSSKAVGSNKYNVTSVYYRITTKSVGPRNTVTYAQAMVLIPE